MITKPVMSVHQMDCSLRCIESPKINDARVALGIAALVAKAHLYSNSRDIMFML